MLLKAALAETGRLAWRVVSVHNTPCIPEGPAIVTVQPSCAVVAAGASSAVSLAWQDYTTYGA